ncbi:hypothetical protein G9A89_001755, partial [Geosiphon pyriformis]
GWREDCTGGSPPPKARSAGGEGECSWLRLGGAPPPLHPVPDGGSDHPARPLQSSPPSTTGGGQSPPRRGGRVHRAGGGGGGQGARVQGPLRPVPPLPARAVMGHLTPRGRGGYQTTCFHTTPPPQWRGGDLPPPLPGLPPPTAGGRHVGAIMIAHGISDKYMRG